MIPSRSTPNLRDNKTTSVYSYLQNQSGLNFAPVSTAPPTRDEDSPPPAPPVRDSSSLKSIKYGPGHEKFPSWPVPAAADTPQALRSQTSGGGSHRSKSWTDHTNYPKEKVVTYTRPYMKRQHSQYTQQKLKTVMEKCEKIPSETFESRYDKMNERLYLPHVDHDGKPLGDMDYMVPSPPERDITNKPQLTQAGLEAYARSYQEPKFCEEPMKPNHGHLTESGLEEFMEYTRNYEDSLFNSMNSKNEESMLTHLHQKQISYAQSEGYHSYVSSTDSTSTPFLDRLRRDSEAVVVRPLSSNTWDELNQEEPNARREGRDSVVTTSSGSASSSETLKWHGSMSDVSVTSHSSSHLANNSSTRQHIAHSARVQTPQRHHSESVLYMSGEPKDSSVVWKDRESRNNSANKLKLFPVNTYTVQENDHHGGGVSNASNNRLSLSLQSALSVADRISELERQQKYSYLDPDKKHKVPDPTLKAIQKKALLSFYERHHNNATKTAWRSEPQLAQSQQLSIPQPPPKLKIQLPSRRASSASDYASGNTSKRSSLASNLESKTTDNISKTIPRHQHSNSCGSLSTDLLGPVIMGPSISVDDWVPEKPPARPPKNPHLRTAFPDLFQDQRVPSPDLPPPSPPTVIEDEVFNSDEPLPPPPPECETSWQEEFNDRLKESTTGHQTPAPQVQKSNCKKESKVIQQTVGIPERNLRHSSVRSSIKTKSGEQIFHQVSSKPYNAFVQAERPSKPEQILGFPNQRGYQERSSTRYPTNQKLVLNGNVAVSQKVNGLPEPYKPEPLRPHNREDMKKQPALPPDTHRAHRASIAESPIKDVPPPLQPRQMRVNQSMRARIPHDHRSGATSKTSPMKDGMRETRSASLSQSKAAYLAPRRDRDRIVPDSETGSYKRTMSPNGHALSPEVINESQRVNSREAIWPLNRNSKDLLKNNNNILRRASVNEKQKKDNCDEKEDLKPNLALPDVLPVNVKLLGPRSQQYNRPTHLSLSPLDNDHMTKSSPKSPMKSPPSSPTKSPARCSPFSPLRSVSLSPAASISTTINSPVIRTSSVTTTPSVTTTINSSVVHTFPITSHTSAFSSSTTTSTLTTRSSPAPISFTPVSRIITNPPPSPESKGAHSPSESPKRLSPIIKPSLSPSTPLKLSPLRISPHTNSSNQSTPLHVSPLTTPTSSPKSPVTPESSPPPSPKKPDDYPRVIEGLQLIQRTEVVLRVNTTTTDAASQTEKEELPPTPLPTRKKLQEEIECEKLAEDFVDHLPTSDRLKELLVPAPEHKKPTDYVQGLFRVDVTSRPRPANSPFRSRNNTPSSTPPPTSLPILTSSTTTSKLSLSPTLPIIPALEPTSPLSGSSIYFTTSEPKAKFLTRYSQDMNKCHIVKDTKDLSQKKEELVNRLDKKLEVLRSEQLVVSDECKINDELGENVETHINRVARPHEVAKFRLHVEEVGKITSLLLGLSGRLARAENALMSMAEDHPERRILEAKRDKLLDQLGEAKKLKECIDRRSVNVSNILYKYLNSEEYADYDHFINMKAKLIMDSKEISDKIKLGEEQLLALKETLIVTD
ncbi:protein Shroom [Anoplophora glabripennis]|nr:protein Shroom [Anoplophora glabripennis]